jgi:hypothetical protein
MACISHESSHCAIPECLLIYFTLIVSSDICISEHLVFRHLTLMCDLRFSWQQLCRLLFLGYDAIYVVFTVVFWRWRRRVNSELKFQATTSSSVPADSWDMWRQKSIRGTCKCFIWRISVMLEVCLLSRQRDRPSQFDPQVLTHNWS